MKITLKSEWFALACFAAALAVTGLWYNDLPAQVPSHWNIAGQIDGYTSPLFHSGLFLGIMLALYGLFLAIPHLEPRKENLQASLPFLATVKNSMLAFFLVLYAAITYMAVYSVTLPIEKIISVCVSLLFLALGYQMRDVKPNYFMGIRTPWSLSSDTNWQQTHKLGATTFMLAGALFLLGIFLPTPYNFAVPMTGIVLAAIVPAVYSYLLYRK